MLLELILPCTISPVSYGHYRIVVLVYNCHAECMVETTTALKEPVSKRKRRRVFLFVFSFVLLFGGLSVVKRVATDYEQATQDRWLMQNPPTVHYRSVPN